MGQRALQRALGQSGPVSPFAHQVREHKGLLEILGWLGRDLGYKKGQWLPAWVPRVAGGFLGF